MGAGLDIVDIDRFERLQERRPEFFERYFTSAERAWAQRQRRPAAAFAEAFAVKEAVLKALGKGVLDGLPVSEIELVRGEIAQVRLGPRVRERLESTPRLRVSVAAAGSQAWAVVLTD